jgi:hypothetical protein
MPIIRIDSHGAVEVDVPHVRQSEEERTRRLLAERQRNREAERKGGYAALVKQPTQKGAEMEKTKEQLEREAVHTSGERFEQERAAHEEKMRVENADTSAGTITRILGGGEPKFIPTAEVYQKEPGEYSEGIPADNPRDREGLYERDPHDQAERALGIPKMGDEISAQHAQGPAAPLAGAVLEAKGELKVDAPQEPEQIRKEDEAKAKETLQAAAEATEDQVKAEEKAAAKAAPSKKKSK